MSAAFLLVKLVARLFKWLILNAIKFDWLHHIILILQITLSLPSDRIELQSQ